MSEAKFLIKEGVINLPGRVFTARGTGGNMIAVYAILALLSVDNVATVDMPLLIEKMDMGRGHIENVLDLLVEGGVLAPVDEDDFYRAFVPAWGDGECSVVPFTREAACEMREEGAACG